MVMTEGPAPNLETVLCGHCEVEAATGQFGGLECPECGRGITARVSYAGRDEGERQEAIRRHSGDSE